jgi:hypothetical protein
MINTETLKPIAPDRQPTATTEQIANGLTFLLEDTDYITDCISAFGVHEPQVFIKEKAQYLPDRPTTSGAELAASYCLGINGEIDECYIHIADRGKLPEIWVHIPVVEQTDTMSPLQNS